MQFRERTLQCGQTEGEAGNFCKRECRQAAKQDSALGSEITIMPALVMLPTYQRLENGRRKFNDYALHNRSIKINFYIL